MSETLNCVVLRCAKQEEMYLYLRADLSQDDIPEALLPRLGALTQVMELELSAQRKLARVDVQQVMQALGEQGYFLQMPPTVQAHLHFGD